VAAHRRSRPQDRDDVLDSRGESNDLPVGPALAMFEMAAVETSASAMAKRILAAHSKGAIGSAPSFGVKLGTLGAAQGSPSSVAWKLAAISPMAYRPSLVVKVKNVRDDFRLRFLAKN
jgi:hypothetical protein